MIGKKYLNLQPESVPFRMGWCIGAFIVESEIKIIKK